MEGIYPVKITVKSIEGGTCHQGHKVGDSWVVEGKVPTGMCADAFCSCAGMCTALRFNGVFPFFNDKDVGLSRCPDPEVSVIFEIRRIRE